MKITILFIIALLFAGTGAITSFAADTQKQNVPVYDDHGHIIPGVKAPPTCRLLNERCTVQPPFYPSQCCSGLYCDLSWGTSNSTCRPIL